MKYNRDKALRDEMVSCFSKIQLQRKRIQLFMAD